MLGGPLTGGGRVGGPWGVPATGGPGLGGGWRGPCEEGPRLGGDVGSLRREPGLRGVPVMGGEVEEAMGGSLGGWGGLGGFGDPRGGGAGQVGRVVGGPYNLWLD